MKNDVQIGVRVPKDLMDKLKKLAEEDDRTVSNYIRRVLAEHVKQEGR